MRLFNYLNPGDDYSNIKFNGTYKRLSKERYTNSEEVKSGLKPTISAKEQLVMHLSWLKNGFTLSHVSFLFQPRKVNFKIYYYLDKLFVFFPWLVTYLTCT